jgi:hypothetical protein
MLSTLLAQNFQQLNPLNPEFSGGTAANQAELSTPGGVISRLLEYSLKIS